MNYRVAVITGTRAEYSLLRPVIKKLLACDEITPLIAVTGSHLVRSLGHTIDEVYADGIPVDAEIDILYDDENTDKGAAAAAALGGFSEYFKNSRPAAAVVLGDRYEIFAAAAAAAINGVPLAHISGGDLTEGASDDFFRHCITKMSCLHFPSTETYRKRVIQLGEEPWRVILAGSLGAENILNLPLLSAKELSKELGFDCERPFILATYHPETLTGNSVEALGELLSALEDVGLPVIFTKSNADEGGNAINAALEKWCVPPDRALFASLGAVRYLSAMKRCAAVVGNSSSAVVEAPSLRTPAVDIGDRQRGRVTGENVINCRAERGDIEAAIKRAVSEEFRSSIEDMTSPYGGDGASGIIVSTLLSFLKNGKMSVRKRFYDVDFEVK